MLLTNLTHAALILGALLLMSIAPAIVLSQPHIHNDLEDDGPIPPRP